MQAKVYVDGHVGTTGLRIRDWLHDREDLRLLTVPAEQRKDPEARRARIEEADLAILCLPDDASREAAAWARASGTRVIDASTAHRVATGWIYGLPELAPTQRSAIREAAQVTNPGCYPTGFLLLVRPLLDAGLLRRDVPLTIHALSGYSGGGRPMIEKWEAPGGPLTGLPFEAPYALDRVHKHIPEMQHYAQLERDPYFEPAVGPFRCGMRVQVPVPAAFLDGRAREAGEVLAARYRNESFVEVGAPGSLPTGEEFGLDPRSCNDTNRIRLDALPHPSGHLLLVARLDNLGKGASGAAIQNLNLMLGMPEETGLPGTRTT